MSELREKVNKTNIHLIRNTDGFVGRNLAYHLECLIDNVRDCLTSMEQRGDLLEQRLEEKSVRIPSHSAPTGFEELQQKVFDVQTQLSNMQREFREMRIQVSSLSEVLDRCKQRVFASEQLNGPQGAFITEFLQVTEMIANLKAQLAGVASNGVCKVR